MVGPYTVMRDSNHGYVQMLKQMKFQTKKCGKIIVEDNCWIASHCTLTMDSYMSEGGVLGANSMLNKKIPRDEIWGGVPARFLKHR